MSQEYDKFEVDGRVQVSLTRRFALELGEFLLSCHPEDKAIVALAHMLKNESGLARRNHYNQNNND